MSNGGIKAVSRYPGSLDVWWVLENGSVQGARLNEDEQWNQYELAPAGSAEHSNEDIAALSMHRDALEVWWIGKEGSVQGARWIQGYQWQRYELAPAGSAISWSKLAAVSKFPGSKDVFWIGPNYSVQGAAWVGGDNWQIYQVAPERSVSYGHITAVSRTPGSLDLFWIRQGSVEAARWKVGEQWELYKVWSSDYAEAVKSISAVAANSWSIYLCWISKAENNETLRYAINYAKWEEDGEWQAGLISYGDDFYPEVITTLIRQQETLEVWWIDFRQRVTGHGQNGDYQIATYGSAERQKITAISSFPGRVDVMWIGADGSVQGATSKEGTQWQRYEISPPPPTPPPVPPLPTGEQRIDVRLESIDGSIGGKNLKITGFGFQANEAIKIFITLYVNNEKIKVDRLTIQADTTTGSFSVQQGVQCSPDQYTIFSVIAQGSISGNSNVLNVICN